LPSPLSYPTVQKAIFQNPEFFSCTFHVTSQEEEEEEEEMMNNI